MNPRLVLVPILVVFAALNVYAIEQHGLVGLFERVLDNSATVLAFVDLAIALTLVMAWMWRDARKRGVSPVPYCALTVLLGSIGPLVYLIRHRGTRAA